MPFAAVAPAPSITRRAGSRRSPLRILLRLRSGFARNGLLRFLDALRLRRLPRPGGPGLLVMTCLAACLSVFLTGCQSGDGQGGGLAGLESGLTGAPGNGLTGGSKEPVLKPPPSLVEETFGRGNAEITLFLPKAKSGFYEGAARDIRDGAALAIGELDETAVMKIRVVDVSAGPAAVVPLVAAAKARNSILIVSYALPATTAALAAIPAGERAPVINLAAPLEAPQVFNFGTDEATSAAQAARSLIAAGQKKFVILTPAIQAVTQTAIPAAGQPAAPAATPAAATSATPQTFPSAPASPTMPGSTPVNLSAAQRPTSAASGTASATVAAPLAALAPYQPANPDEERLKRLIAEAGGTLTGVIHYDPAATTPTDLLARGKGALDQATAAIVMVNANGAGANGTGNAASSLNGIRTALAGLRAAYPRLVIVGTNAWPQTLYTDPAASGAILATYDPDGFALIGERYNRYNHRPLTPDAALGYDTIAIAAGIVRTKGPTALNPDTITTKTGFRGVTGLFRFSKAGTLERKTLIYKINQQRLTPTDTKQPAF